MPDAVICIQGIVRLVVADTLGIGRLVTDAGPERLGHIVSSWSVSGSAGDGGIVYYSADLDNFVQSGDFDRQRRFY